MSKKSLIFILAFFFAAAVVVALIYFVGYRGNGGGENVRTKINEHKEAIETDVLPAPSEVEGSKLEGGVEGVVKRLDASIYMEGTHYLVDEKGITLTLLESTAGLDLDKYVGKKIRVWGKSRMTVEGDGTITDVERIEIAN